jgi:hypothetical protein
MDMFREDLAQGNDARTSGEVRYSSPCDFRYPSWKPVTEFSDRASTPRILGDNRADDYRDTRPRRIYSQPAASDSSSFRRVINEFDWPEIKDLDTEDFDASKERAYSPDGFHSQESLT